MSVCGILASHWLGAGGQGSESRLFLDIGGGHVLLGRRAGAGGRLQALVAAEGGMEADAPVEDASGGFLGFLVFFFPSLTLPRCGSAP